MGYLGGQLDKVVVLVGVVKLLAAALDRPAAVLRLRRLDGVVVVAWRKN